jgi:hypothetical protein
MNEGALSGGKLINFGGLSDKLVLLTDFPSFNFLIRAGLLLTGLNHL